MKRLIKLRSMPTLPNRSITISKQYDPARILAGFLISNVMEATSKTKNESQRSTDQGVVSRITDLFNGKPESETDRNVKMGIKAVLSNTVLKRLPTPLNVVVPMAVEKVILKYGIPEGR